MELIHKSELTGTEVQKLAKLMKLRVSVFQYDQLPEELNPGMYIILLGQNVGHWVALYVLKHTAAYYDSYGIPPPEEIYKALADRIVFYSTNEDQNLTMNHCGQFSLRFLHKMLHKI